MAGAGARAYGLCAPVLYSALSFSAHAGPQTLEQAWVKAYQTNPGLEAQRASLRAIDEQVSQALADWRPSVDATASAGKTYQYTPEVAPFQNPTLPARSAATARN